MPRLTAWPSPMRQTLQRANRFPNFDYRGAREIGVGLSEVVKDAVVGRLPRRESSGYASRLKHTVNARVHVPLLYKLAAVRLFKAFAHRSPEMLVLFEQAQGSLLYHAFSVRAGLTGDF